jgi:hypothetical protein
MLGRSGLIGIVVVIALLNYSGAGSWAARQLSAINTGCYATLSGISQDIANPVCRNVAAFYTASADIYNSTSDKVRNYTQKLLGNTPFDVLDDLATELTENVTDMASSSSDLSRMLSLGPNNPMAFSPNDSFQNAIDSFTIGQSSLKTLRPAFRPYHGLSAALHNHKVMD